MDLMSEIILPAGRSAVDITFFLLLPVMIVMLTIMRLLEAAGVLDRLVVALTPALRPFGLPGLGVFAALQISFVSFAAPVATLAVMDKRGASDRHLAATLAMVLAMAQANTSLPLTADGLALGPTLAFSLAGGLLAAAVAWYLTGRRLDREERITDDNAPPHPDANSGKAVLDIINHAGAEAFRIALGALPLLLLSLVAVVALNRLGAVAALTGLLAPTLSTLGIDPVLVLPTVTKYVAGGTGALGVLDGMARHGEIGAALINKAAGFLIHPLDLPGVAILISAGPRVGAVWKPAALAACAGIALRTAAHVLWF